MGNTVVKKVSPSSSLDNFNIQNKPTYNNIHKKNTPVKYVTCLDVTSENIDENIYEKSIKFNNVPLFIECPNCNTHVNYVCFHTWKHDSKSRKCLHCKCSKMYRDSE